MPWDSLQVAATLIKIDTHNTDTAVSQWKVSSLSSWTRLCACKSSTNLTKAKVTVIPRKSWKAKRMTREDDEDWKKRALDKLFHGVPIWLHSLELIFARTFIEYFLDSFIHCRRVQVQVNFQCEDTVKMIYIISCAGQLQHSGVQPLWLSLTFILVSQTECDRTQSDIFRNTFRTSQVVSNQVLYLIWLKLAMKQITTLMMLMFHKLSYTIWHLFFQIFLQSLPQPEVYVTLCGQNYVIKRIKN